jgi:hypothetical protein
MFAFLLAAATVGAPVQVVGNWAIYRRSDTACLMVTTDRDHGTELLVGMDRNYPKQAALGVSDAAWTSLREGQSEPVDFLADGSSFETSRPVAGFLNGRMFLAGETAMWKVEKAFRNMATLSVTYNGDFLFLDGYPSIAAYRATRQCAGLGNDPFAR